MSSKNIISNPNNVLRTYVLEGESVKSLLDALVQRAGGQGNNLFGRNIYNLIPLVKNITPQQVEEAKINDILEISKQIFSTADISIVMKDDYFNTLNLCVVGLGTKLREQIYG